MKKMPSLFIREWEGDRTITEAITPGAEWVIEGEGVATRKWDGTSCLVQGGKLYKRYDAKGKRAQNLDAKGFMPAQPEPDPVSGHWPGWVPVDMDPKTSHDYWHLEGWDAAHITHWGKTYPPDDGTYELIGPKVQGGIEGVPEHRLIRHGEDHLLDAPRDFAGLRAYLQDRPGMEGIVWHHPDGRMVKLKRRDFGKEGQ